MVLQSGVRLPRAPESKASIVWSEDCELAVACEETVEILLPKLKIFIPLCFSKEAEAEAEHWQTVRIVVNQFHDPSELRLLMPSAFDIMSIGEEQSPSTVISLGWSPAGLSRFGRCALAVLTSNLVLSIWAHRGNPTVASNWQRVLIVNEALSSSPSPTPASTSSSSSSTRAAIKRDERLRTRIRSFSWSPALKQPPHATRKGGDSFFIAIANDIDVVCVCEIRSPFVDLLGPQPRWTAQVLFNVRCPPEPKIPPSTFSHVDVGYNLAWSPWIDDVRATKPSIRSCLSFALNRKALFAEFSFDYDHTPRPTISLVRDAFILHDHPVGPTRWACHPTKRNKLILASVGTKCCITVLSLFDSHVGFSLSQSHHHQTFFWSKNSAISLGLSEGNLKVYRVLDWTRDPAPARFDVPLDLSQPIEQNSWDAMTACLREAFADTDRTHPHGSIIKCWGISSTFSHDYVALCTSAQPKDVIYHSQPAERHSFVLILPVNSSVPAPILTSNAEATCFSLGRYIRNQCGIAGNSIAKAEAFDRWMDTTLGQPMDWTELLQLNPQIATPADAVSYLRKLFQPHKLVLSRIQGSISQSIQFSSPGGIQDPSPKLFPMWLLLRAVRKMPRSIFCSSRVSNLILNHYCQAEIMLSQTWSGYFWLGPRETSLSDYFLTSRLQNQQCDICHSDIPLVALEWGTCGQGHTSARCALTLLVIQSPGSSVYCVMCNTRYLTKEYLISLDQKLEGFAESLSSTDGTSDHMEVEGDDVAVEAGDASSVGGGGDSDGNTEASRSLLDVLMAGCATCIQCGGKLGVE